MYIGRTEIQIHTKNSTNLGILCRHFTSSIQKSSWKGNNKSWVELCSFRNRKKSTNVRHTDHARSRWDIFNFAYFSYEQFKCVNEFNKHMVFIKEKWTKMRNKIKEKKTKRSQFIHLISFSAFIFLALCTSCMNPMLIA